MKLTDHLNLINNHGYKGGIAISKIDIGMSALKGDVVLFRRYEVRDDMDEEDIKYQLSHCSIEKPYSEAEIKSRPDALTTYCTCVAVPLKYLDIIEI